MSDITDRREIHYDYDANGNATSIQPPSRPAHIFSYNFNYNYNYNYNYNFNFNFNFNYNAFNLENEYIPPSVGVYPRRIHVMTASC